MTAGKEGRGREAEGKKRENLAPRGHFKKSAPMAAGALGEFSIFIGRILSTMMRFGIALDNPPCLTLSVGNKLFCPA